MITTSLTTPFAQLPDPRSGHGRRYGLSALVTIAICAAICGAEDWVGVAAFGEAKEDWFRTFLDLPHGVPSHDTFDRVFARLDPDAFEQCFRLWTQALTGELAGVISLDGKTLRRSFDRATGKTAMHMVSAWACEHGIVFGQQAVDEKSNEISAMMKLLELLDIKGITVTIDAMGCQKAIAQKIVEKGGEYVLAVKDNQPTLAADVRDMFARMTNQHASGAGMQDTSRSDMHEEIEKGHGRIERRVTTITWDARQLVAAQGWPAVACLARVQRTRTIGDVTTTSEHFFIASMVTHKAQRVAQAVRAHWGVENELHWRLDVSFNEDQSRLRKGHGAENMSRLRRISLNCLKKDASKKMGIKNKRLLAGWDHRFLLGLLKVENG
jgi:predicted transposase YbfD/YdcC